MDYYAMLYAHPMVHGSLFTDTEHGMHVVMLMIASIVQLLSYS